MTTPPFDPPPGADAPPAPSVLDKVESTVEKALVAFEDLAPEVQEFLTTLGRHLGIGVPEPKVVSGSPDLPPPPTSTPDMPKSADGNYQWNGTAWSPVVK